MALRKNRFFHWNKRERRGSLVLLFLLSAMSFFYGYLKRMPDQSWKPDPEFLKLAEQFADTPNTFSERAYKPADRYADKPFSRNTYPPISGPFNPNGLPEAEWINMGLSAPQAKALKNFEARGGRFYKKEDLKKVFVISASFYAHIEPYVLIPAAPGEKEKSAFPPNEPKVSARVDINRADSAALDSLPGISPKLAGRMIRFRQVFGGFVSVSQVKDMPGFFADSYDRLTQKAFTGSVLVKPVNLNYCTFKELLLLPGMTYECVKAILNHRERNGFFRKTEDLVTLNLAEPDLYLKIAPYIEVR